MRKLCRIALVAVVMGGLLLTRSAKADMSQEFLPTDHWANGYIYELYASGAWGRWPIGTQPWNRGEIAERIRSIVQRDSTQHQLSTTERHLIDRLLLEFGDDLKKDTARSDMDTRAGGELFGRAGYDRFANPQYRGRAQGYFGLGTGIWWVRMRGDIDSHGETDPTFFGQEWKDKFTGTVDIGYFTLRTGGFELEAGRDFIRWGSAPHDALLLNDQSPPFNMARFAYHHKWFDFSFFFTGLDSAFANPDDDSVDTAPDVKRYLSGHRLELRPSGALELGISEVIVYGGPNRQLEAYYLNPFLPYYWEQLNYDSDDNPLWSLDVSWRIPKGPLAYGELLVDDFQIDLKSEPQQVGWMLGFDWLDLWSGSNVVFDWTHIEPTVYGQNRPYNRYLNHRVGMGSSMGPDAERYFLRVRQHLSSTLDVTASGLLQRNGERNIDTPQNVAVQRGEFPSGVTQTTTQTELQVYYQPSSWLRLDVTGGYRWLDNPDHVPNTHQRGGYVAGSIAITRWHTGAF